MYPPELMRRLYVVSIYNLFETSSCSEVYLQTSKEEKAMAVRDIKAAHIGKIVKLRGIVIRSTEV